MPAVESLFLRVPGGWLSISNSELILDLSTTYF